MRTPLLLVLLFAAAGALAIGAGDDARLGSFDDALAAIDGARQSITVSAYTLNPERQQRFLGELERAAARGVKVHIVLTGEGFGYALEQNRELASSPHGMRVDLLDRPIHLKALVVDGGRIVALSDENFSRCGAVLFLDSQFALPVERAAIGDPHEDLPLTVTKGRALALEAALIDRAKRNVTVETESFSGNNAVAAALAHAAQRGVHVHLIVNGSEAQSNGAEQNVLVAMRSLPGASVSYQSGTAKGAVIDDSVAFFGSSNASEGLEDQIDFGYASTNTAFVEAIAAQVAAPDACR
jgi:phosphatidylserine/phosphatidylglycerophosphate/cardiolipin synthase-like enzyme